VLVQDLYQVESRYYSLMVAPSFIVEETGVPEEKHWPVASHWQTVSHNVSSTPRHERDSNSQH